MLSLFMCIEATAVVCGQVFVELHQDKLGHFKKLNKQAALIASLIPGFNLLLIYAVFKYILTGKE